MYAPSTQKKGELSLFKNYRPIALINMGVKIFTHLIKDRLMPIFYSNMRQPNGIDALKVRRKNGQML